jgi:hypothetical protein
MSACIPAPPLESDAAMVSIFFMFFPENRTRPAGRVLDNLVNLQRISKTVGYIKIFIFSLV